MQLPGGRSRILIIFAFFIVSAALLFVSRPLLKDRLPLDGLRDFRHHPAPQQLPTISISEASCRGARGGALSYKSEDLPHGLRQLPSNLTSDVDSTFPEPTMGSYDALGLEKTWMTFSQRYGPYGYGEDDANYSFTRADWSAVDWGHLQDQCLLAGSKQSGVHPPLQSGALPRFRLVEDKYVQNTQKESTGRQAVVMRVWDSYKYTPEDRWNIRSIITEAGLATDGKYTVVLLVDVKRKGGEKIHEDDDYYQEVLEDCVPEEFRSIAVLFHRSLQESWYAKVKEFRPVWQIMQPLQLFAHFYPEFDHYWQFEMDSRFTGDMGKMLQAYSKFAENEPYKQSRERSSWTYLSGFHGSYDSFLAGVNQSLEGGATTWGPQDPKIPGLVPVGPKPPVSDPKEENFEWGVGKGADLLFFSPIFDVLRFETIQDWVFKDWHPGMDDDTPRYLAAPAQYRASRELLKAIHDAQHELGVAVPGEATLPTFAMWNGLQVVQLPIPKYQWPTRNFKDLNAIYNGGPPTAFEDGIAYGMGPYSKRLIEWFERPRTWEWSSSLTVPTWAHWVNEKEGKLIKRFNFGNAADGYVPPELPPYMREVGGEVYAPGFMMHPKKTQ